jgi:guanylate kinase
MWQGVRQIKKTSLNPVYLFISPPNMQTLRERLRGRGTDDENAIHKRLTTALREIEYAQGPQVHDLVIVNDDLDRAYTLFKQVALGDRIEGDRLPPLDD